MKTFKQYCEDFNNWRNPVNAAPSGPDIVNYSAQSQPQGFKGGESGPGGNLAPMSIESKKPKKKMTHLQKLLRVLKKKSRITESKDSEVDSSGATPKFDKNGGKFWYLNGKLHRIDGPVAEYTNGNKFWYLNDKEYSEEEYWKHPEVVAFRKLRHLDPKNYKIAKGMLDI